MLACGIKVIAISKTYSLPAYLEGYVYLRE